MNSPHKDASAVIASPAIVTVIARPRLVRVVRRPVNVVAMNHWLDLGDAFSARIHRRMCMMPTTAQDRMDEQCQSGDDSG